jgi:glycosyltransferase involved in cell wall biosynthesis
LNRAAAVVGQSQELQRLLREAGVKPEKLHTIYNGVEQDVFVPGDRAAARAELGLPAAEQILLYVGNLLPVKNPLLLVQAHAELLKRNPGPPCRLVMIGTGPLRGAIERESARLGTRGLVLLAGSQPPASVTRYLQAASLVCISSRNEGLPNVLNEAFSCGRRVVATRVGGIPEVLTGDFLGRVGEPGNAAAMAEAIQAVLAEPEESEKIIRHVRQYSWENCAAQHARLLEAAAQKIVTPTR